MVKSTAVTGSLREITTHSDGQECSVNLTNICAFVTAQTNAQTDTATHAHSLGSHPLVVSQRRSQSVSQCQSASVTLTACHENQINCLHSSDAAAFSELIMTYLTTEPWYR